MMSPALINVLSTIVHIFQLMISVKCQNRILCVIGEGETTNCSGKDFASGRRVNVS